MKNKSITPENTIIFVALESELPGMYYQTGLSSILVLARLMPVSQQVRLLRHISQK